MRDGYTDAKYEVIAGPDPRLVRWQKPGRSFDILTVIRWTFVVLLVGAALFTALMGLAGADIDTRDTGNATSGPIPIPAVEPAPSSAGQIRR